MDAQQLSGFLRPVRHVLLDFDGPVCSVFAGLPAPVVAARLSASLGDPSARWAGEDDPMAVLRFVDVDRPEAVATTDGLLERLENEAVRVAEPTPGADLVLKACADTGRAVWIVSNNAESAIRAYLAQHGLRGYVSGVFGRVLGEPSAMKPNPRLLADAMAAASAQPADCVFIGDTVTDVQAGDAAGVPTIGYANKPGKDAALTGAGAATVVPSMHALADGFS
ncbi:HAD family hydrolase [Kitasatospora sp. NPDC056783]|uniref:HAD family hydrolase n=1 Tax=Kitasatospora sp. NPDC056783 TaxID=3345943 RepID=UPI0036AD8796